MHSILDSLGAALAHNSGHGDGYRWFSEPLALAGIVLMSILYCTGVTRCWKRAGPGRGIGYVQVMAFGAGVAVLAAALISPIDYWADQLGWVHMLQHMLLMMWAAPLLALGAPASAALWALPPAWRRGIGDLLQHRAALRKSRYLLWQPLLLWLLYASVLWVWHLPVLYEAALRDELLHDLQHLMFVVVACLYWRVLIDPLSRLRLTPALAVIYLFTTSLHAILLGVFMTLSPRPWYEPYTATTGQWGLAALEDQQIAGMLMWMPVSMMYGFWAAAILLVWVRDAAPPAELNAPWQLHPDKRIDAR